MENVGYFCTFHASFGMYKNPQSVKLCVRVPIINTVRTMHAVVLV